MGRQPNERSEVRLVDQIFTSWNPMTGWLKQVEGFKKVA
jgi:hypothetical protein